MKKLHISDRKRRIWKDRCEHEINETGTKHCNLLLNEDTGECPKGHGRLLHMCETGCCGELVAGNHRFCKYHRKSKLKSMCKIEEKIQREYRLRMGWTKKQFNGLNIDTYEGKKDFEGWARKQRETTYDKDVLNAEKQSKENKS